MLISGKWSLSQSFWPRIRARYYPIDINVKGKHDKNILCLRPRILASEKVDSFMLYIMFSDTPVRLLGDSLVANPSRVPLMWSMLEARWIKDHAALHVGQVRHQPPILHFNVPMLESREVNFKHVWVNYSQARGLTTHRIHAIVNDKTAMMLSNKYSCLV